jgi:hypothetical protein
MKSLTIHIGNTSETYQMTDKKRMKAIQDMAQEFKNTMNLQDYGNMLLENFEDLTLEHQQIATVAYLSFSQYFQFKGHVVVAFEHTPFGLFCEYRIERKLPKVSAIVELYKELLFSRPELLKYKMFQQSVEDVVSQ